MAGQTGRKKQGRRQTIMSSAGSRLRRPMGGFLMGAALAALIVTSFTGASLVLLGSSLAVGNPALDNSHSRGFSRLTLVSGIGISSRV